MFERKCYKLQKLPRGNTNPRQRALDELTRVDAEPCAWSGAPHGGTRAMHKATTTTTPRKGNALRATLNYR